MRRVDPSSIAVCEPGPLIPVSLHDAAFTKSDAGYSPGRASYPKSNLGRADSLGAGNGNSLLLVPKAKSFHGRSRSPEGGSGDDRPQSGYLIDMLRAKGNRQSLLMQSLAGGADMVSPQSLDNLQPMLRKDRASIAHSAGRSRPNPNASVSVGVLDEGAEIRTGKQVIEYYMQHGPAAEIKLFYLNQAEQARDAYDPYDLIVVEKEQARPEHYIISASGVVHTVPDGEAEVYQLGDFMREMSMFRMLRHMRFFRFYTPRKFFNIWRAEASAAAGSACDGGGGVSGRESW